MDVQAAFEMNRQFDAVVIFDADNLVHPDFLMEMNSRYQKGNASSRGILIPRTLMIRG